MAEANVRQLKSRTSEMLRAVREERARYVITYRGKPVAVLAPVETGPIEHTSSEGTVVWDELVRLGDRISRGWRSRRSPTELLSRMRR